VNEPDAQAIFHAVFAEPTADDFVPYLAAWDFSCCRVVADLGGAGGGLLATILVAHPGARGILVDRTQAMEGAAQRFAAAGLTDRCELVGGDLLESVPEGADVYLMRCVLHGYDDESSLRILRNVRRAMKPEGRLLLIEVVLPDRIDRADPEIERLIMSDLNMLAVTGGGERTEREWRELLVAAGLELRRVLPVTGQAILEVARSSHPGRRTPGQGEAAP
jgi:SAM-dependent methyltransferase